MTSETERNEPRSLALTEKQREVMRLMAQGRTNFEIAQALGLSLEGAKYHVSEILGKYGVASREEAIALWRAQQTPAARFRRLLAGMAAAVPHAGRDFALPIVAVALTVAAGLGVYWIASPNESNEPQTNAQIETGEQFLAAMEERLSQDGKVLAVTMNARVDFDQDGVPEPVWSEQSWVDLPNERARAEWTRDPRWEVDLPRRGRCCWSERTHTSATRTMTRRNIDSPTRLVRIACRVFA